MEEILDRPRNANELAEILNLDYKTVRHHLDVLEKNRLVAPPRIRGSGGYGKMYFPSEILEENMEYFNEIWGEIGKNKIKKKRDKD